MPLNLRDLAPFLTPYQAPMSLDLSGVAQHISQNADRAQALQIANQTDATDRAELAEDQRSAQAQEQQARDEAAAAAAKAQHEEEMKLVGQVPAMVDPLAERALRGQMASAGMGVKDTEGRDYGFAPGLEMPGMPAFAEPSVALSTAQPAASPDGDAFINQLDPRGKKGQMLPRDVARNGRLGPLLGDVSEGQDAEFGGFIDALTAPAVEGMAPLGYSPDRTVVTGKDGQELTEFSPVDARGRARLTLDTALDKLLAGSPELSAPIAARAKSMAESTLMAAGYDPQAALDMLVSKTFTPEMQEIYATERSKFTSQATMGRGVGTQERLEFEAGRKGMDVWFRESGGDKKIRAYQKAMSALKASQGKMNAAQFSALVYNAAKSNDEGAIVTRQDFEAAGGQGSLLEMSQAAFQKWMTGAPRSVIDRIREVIKQRAEEFSAASLEDFQAGVQMRDGEISDWGRKGADLVLERYKSMPWYRAARLKDPHYTRLRRMQGGGSSGSGGVSGSSSARGGPLANPQPAAEVDVPDAVLADELDRENF